MSFAQFKNENEAAGLPIKGNFQAGVSNVDSGMNNERGILIPWASDPSASWMYYDITLSCILDSGIVTHRHLPQVDNTADTLASCFVSDPDIDKIINKGVNLKSNDRYDDVVQRMAHSQYRFCLSGQAIRIGYQVPIPGLVKMSNGAKFIPHDGNPQRAFNKIAGNYSGVPLWYAKWELWYTLASAPKVQMSPPANLAAHIGADETLPEGMQAPQSQPDSEALPNAPGQIASQFQSAVVQ